jgi:probable phosphoglycerate mutase
MPSTASTTERVHPGSGDMMHGMGELILIRHGETEWSRSGQHAGRTDIPLTEAGVAAGKALAPVLARRHLAAAFSSPLSRAMRTAELAGLTGVKPVPDLLEWDYGGYEGMTASQIQELRPGWDLWRDGVIPGDTSHPGETLQQVAARTDALLDRVRPLLYDGDGDVALVAHGHLQRVLTSRWLGLDPSAGRLFRHPHPGTLSALGIEHEHTVVSTWNVP